MNRTEESRLVRNLLAAAANNRDKDNGHSVHPFNTADHNRSVPKRPSSSNPTKRRSRSSTGNRHQTRQQEAENAILPDRSSRLSTEDLVNEIMELKKKLLINEDTISFLKSENHRLETEATKQQRRIEQLLNLSEGVKTSTMAQSVRREIEKSILVRQLKQQLAHLRNLVADKDVEIENMKRDIRFSRVKEVEFERDEYYSEIQRLVKTVDDVKDELHRERQRREWNSKLAGETGDDLRKELAKLASGYQSILANISASGKSSARPSTAGATRSTDNALRKQDSTQAKDAHGGRPRSAGGNMLDQSRKVNSPQQNLNNGENDDVSVTVVGQNPPVLEITGGAEQGKPDMEGWEQLETNNDLNDPSVEAGFNTEDYETTDGNSSRGTGIEPKITFQPLGAFLPQQQAVFFQAPQVITALPTVPQYQFQPKFNAGDRIKAKFRGGETYYPGRISVVQADGLYRVVYDDNDEEGNVPEERIMLMEEGNSSSGAASIASAHAGTNLYRVGDKVEAIYYSGSTWYKGEIKGFTYLEPKKSFVYDVVYEDGDREKQVLEANVRLFNSPQNTNGVDPYSTNIQNYASAESIPTIDETTIASVVERPTVNPVVATTANPVIPSNETTSSVVPAPSAPIVDETPVPLEFQIGDLIEALYDKGTMWFPGKISATNIVGQTVTYDIAYDDGDKETKVADAFIRKRPLAPTATTTAASGNVPSGALFKIGEKVEGYFEEYKAWFAGQIKGVNEDGTFHVLYEDGDEEKTVVAVRLRKKVVSIRKDKYMVGDLIEARYQGDAAWFPGKIIKVNNIGGKLSYNILYDDGDTEEEVVSELIRVLDGTLSKAPSSADIAAAVVTSPIKSLSVSKPVVATPTLPVKVSPRSNNEGSANSKQYQRHGSITSTNLDSFLNELSDDDDGPLPPIGAVESSGENEYRDEFEA